MPAKSSRLKALEELMAAPGFWDNQEKARTVVGELKALKAVIEPVDALVRRAEDAQVLFDLAREENDPAALAEVDRELGGISEQFDRVDRLEQINTILQQPIH